VDLLYRDVVYVSLRNRHPVWHPEPTKEVYLERVESPVEPQSLYISQISRYRLLFNILLWL
jgi:hypothetical protein